MKLSYLKKKEISCLSDKIRILEEKNIKSYKVRLDLTSFDNVVKEFNEFLKSNRLIIKSYITKNTNLELTLHDGFIYYHNISGQHFENNTDKYEIKNSCDLIELGKNYFVSRYTNGHYWYACYISISKCLFQGYGWLMIE